MTAERGLVCGMEMEVNVRTPTVAVEVMVEHTARPERAQEVQAEAHQHHGDPQLEPPGESEGDLRVQPDHDNRGGEERGRMTEAPECADERRAPEIPALAHDRRNRGQ